MAQQDAWIHTEATPLLISSADGAKSTCRPSYGSLGADGAREGEDQAEASTTLPTSDSLNGDVSLHTHTLAPVMVGSAKKTFFNIVITIVGSGVLGLPYTFMRSGWLLASVTVVLSALLSYHCMLLLVRPTRTGDAKPATPSPPFLSTTLSVASLSPQKRPSLA